MAALIGLALCLPQATLAAPSNSASDTSGTSDNGLIGNDAGSVISLPLNSERVAPAPVPEVPTASPYVLTLTRAADGSTVMSGYVPVDALRQYLAAVLETDGSQLELAGNPPAGFVENSRAAAEALLLLSEGRAGFDGGVWYVIGTLSDGQSEAGVEAVLANAGTEADLWAVTLTPAPASDSPPAAEVPSEEQVSAADEESPAAEPALQQSPALDGEGIEATQAEAEAPVPEVDPSYTFLAERDAGGAVTLTGQVPADATRRFLATLASSDPSRLELAPGAPADFAASATAGVRALALLETGSLTLEEGKWTLRGHAATEALASEAAAEVTALLTTKAWHIDISAPPAIETCQAGADAFSARNGISFRSGSSTLTEESSAAIADLARVLAACPDAAVNVEGHTDADGAEDRNLALSVARAEAVVSALTGQGIDPQRLYALGFGESLPIADNDTAAGKQLNRRIVVRVLTPEQAAAQ